MLTFLRNQDGLDLHICFLQLLQQTHIDRHQIKPRQLLALINTPHTRAHDLRLDPIRLVVLPDPLRHNHARILPPRVVHGGVVLMPPIQRAPDKRADQRRAHLGRQHGLRQPEQERQVAANPFLLENPTRLEPLPRARDLDEHALAPDAALGVQRADAARVRDRGSRVEAVDGVDLGRDAAGHVLQDRAAEGDEEVQEGQVDLLVGVGGFGACVAGRVGEEVGVLGLLAGGEDVGGVGGGVLGFVEGEDVEVARVGDDGGVLAELFEGGHGLFFNFTGLASSLIWLFGLERTALEMRVYTGYIYTVSVVLYCVMVSGAGETGGCRGRSRPAPVCRGGCVMA